MFDRKEFEINIVKEEYTNKPYIVKHSPNIIDLIEVGDYVNGKEITDIQTLEIMGNTEKYLIYDISKINCSDYYRNGAFTENNIKEVVTKEAFKSVSFEV